MFNIKPEKDFTHVVLATCDHTVCLNICMIQSLLKKSLLGLTFVLSQVWRAVFMLHKHHVAHRVIGS